MSSICEAQHAARAADDIAFCNQAMRQAAQAYLQRPFQAIQYEEDLLTHSHLAMCFAWAGCTDALSRLAEEFTALDVRLAEFDLFDSRLLCKFADAFGQTRPTDKHLSRAMQILAEEVVHRLRYDRHFFTTSQLSRLLAAFDGRDPLQADAVRQIAALLRPLDDGFERAPRPARAGPRTDRGSGRSLDNMSGKALGCHARNLARRPGDPANQRDMARLARFLAEASQANDTLSRYSWRVLPGLANCLSKFLENRHAGRRQASERELIPRVKQAMGAVALAIVRREQTSTGQPGLGHATPIDLFLLVNGCCKCVGDSSDCSHALDLLAREVLLRRNRLAEFDAIAVSNLVNGLSKRAGDSTDCNAALDLLAREVHLRNDILAEFESRHLSNLVNGLSKRAGDSTDCNTALDLLAREVRQRTDKLAEFEHRHLSTMVNGLSKRAGDSTDCNAALDLLAREVLSRTDKLTEFGAIELSILINGLSKRAGDSTDCNAALDLLAREVRRRRNKLAEFDAIAVSILVNGLSKRAGDSTDCNAALDLLAREVLLRKDKLVEFKNKHLSSLVNGLSKRAGDSTHCNAALDLLAQEVDLRRNKLAEFDAIAVSNLVNGLSKRAGDSTACNAALDLLAREVLLRTDKLAEFDGIAVSNLVNGLSKRTGNSTDCNTALDLLAREVLLRRDKLAEFGSIAVSNLINGVSKRAGDSTDCNAALDLLADEVHKRRDKLAKFDYIELSILVNGLSKRAGDSTACNTALDLLAREVLLRTDKLAEFNDIELSSLVNGLSKRAGNSTDCNIALDLLAQEVDLRRDKLAEFDGIAVCNLVNGLSKRAGDSTDCNTALDLLAREVLMRSGKPAQFDEIELSNLVNGLSKRAGDSTDCNAALDLLAREVLLRKNKLTKFDGIAVSSLVNGLSKRAGDSTDCNAALDLLAQEVDLRRNKLAEFDGIAVCNLVNGLSKRAGDSTDCNTALDLLAHEVLLRTDKLAEFESQQWSSLVNGFSRLLSQPACRDAIGLIAHHVGMMDAQRLAQCLSMHLKACGVLCLGMSRCAQHELAPGFASPAVNAERCIAAMRAIANSLLAMPIADFKPEILSMALLLRAMHGAGLASQTRSLANHGWTHLSSLLADGALASTDLETIGTLSQALMILGRSRADAALRKKALALLVKQVLPAAWRKIALRANPPKPGDAAPGEATSTRFPEYSYYAIARAGAEAIRHWTRRNTQCDDRRHLKTTRRLLHDNSRKVWEALCAINNGDISRASWNMIAQLEADSPSSILDDFVARYWQAIKDQPAPAQFNPHGAFDQLSAPPRPPAAGLGLVTVPRSDFAGKTPPGEAPQPRYTILARLSQGQLPLLQVDLPAILTPFLLGRAVHYNGIAYRVDVTGGSGMKPQRAPIEQAYPSADTANGQAAQREDACGKLYALRVTDTGPGTDFARLMEALFPYTEAYYYFQRALMSSPPAIAAAHGPAAHVLEGRFRMAVLPDCAPGQHPFRLRDSHGNNIALQPHDGLGFIRASIAQRFAWFAELNAASNEPFGGRQQRANLPPDALQHYPDDREAAAELAGQMPLGAAHSGLYRSLTQGAHGKGHIAKAVPSAGDAVVLPASKAVASHVLLGRAPYECAKLQPVPQEQLLRGDDASARFLDSAAWLQYSFVCRNEDGNQARSLSFFKGGLIVVSDALWPADYADCDLVVSAEDEKSRGTWRDAKARHRQEMRQDCPAILAVTEAFGPGSCVAVPLALQKAMGGDYDGDDVLVVSGLPALHRLVSQYRASHAAPELKPPKSYTPAYRDGQYFLGRSAQIAATRMNVLGRYTVLQRRLLLLPEAQQQALAGHVLDALCKEGLDSTLETQVEALLEAAQPAPDKVQALLDELDRRASHSHTATARSWFAGLAGDVRHLVGLAPNAATDALATLLPPQPLPAEARERLTLWLAHLPWSGPDLPQEVWQAHLRGDDRQGLASLLMLGIKAGGDACKSDTGVLRFDRIARKLERLYGEQKVSALVPYTRQTMGLIAGGKFDDALARQYSEALAPAPNLAAAVMRNTLAQWLDTAQGNHVPASEDGMQIEMREQRQSPDRGMEEGQVALAIAPRREERSAGPQPDAQKHAATRRTARSGISREAREQERRTERPPTEASPARTYADSRKRKRDEPAERRVRQCTGDSEEAVRRDMQSRRPATNRATYGGVRQ